MTTEKVANGNATELDTFLPQDNSTINGVTKYKISKSNDLQGDSPEYDPFKNRNLKHPVSNCDTLTHLLKAALGTGILAMPAAFKASGLVLGIFATVAVAVICTHCAYILVICAHELYKRSGKSAMGFAEVAEEACLRGPKWAKKFAGFSRMSVQVLIFITYYLTCSCYAVIISKNINYVLEVYLNVPVGTELDIRKTIACLLVPTLLLAYVPNLKYLAPVSMISNAFMAVGLGITFYYLVEDIPDISDRNLTGTLVDFPVFFGTTIFAIEAIGVVMPLENNMASPRSFVGLCGVLNQGMSGVTLVYIVLGFFGYLKYGSDTRDSITLNLDKYNYAGQAVNILIALAVFGTTGLQFYVCLDIIWNGIKEKFSDKRKTLANYGLRTVLVIVFIGIAILVPQIIPFVSLIGAFCFSILGIITPVFIEVITFWDKGFGKWNWKIVKDVILVVAGIFALVFGSNDAIGKIIGTYTSQANTTSLLANNTISNNTLNES